MWGAITLIAKCIKQGTPFETQPGLDLVRLQSKLALLMPVSNPYLGVLDPECFRRVFWHQFNDYVAC